MKDKINEILNELGLENASEVTDRIAKEVALHTVPKQTYNDLSQKLKNETTARTNAEEKVESLKVKADDADVKTSEVEKLLKENEEMKKDFNRLQARTILEKANVSEEKIEELLEQVVTANKEATITLANSFAEVLKSQNEEVKKKTETELLQNTPKPKVKEVSNAPKEISKDEFNNMTYAQRKELFFSDRETFEKLSA